MMNEFITTNGTQKKPEADCLGVGVGVRVGSCPVPSGGWMPRKIKRLFFLFSK